MKKLILSAALFLLPCLAAAGNITISAAHVNGNVLQVVSSDTVTNKQINTSSLIGTNLGCQITTVQTNSKIVVMAMGRTDIESIGNGINLNIVRLSPLQNLLVANNWVSAPATVNNSYEYPTLIGVDNPLVVGGTVLNYQVQGLSANTNPVDFGGEQYMICEEIAQ